MTSQALEDHWLSLRLWARDIVLPSALILLVLLAVFYAVFETEQMRDQAAAICGFFTLYFVLLRGGHMLMIRSMHFDLKKTFSDKYEQRLAKLPENGRDVNLGFALARIKRDLIHAKKK